MIEYYIFKKNENKIEQMDNYSSGCWINVIDPSEDEIESLTGKFELNHNNLIDGLDIYENPRFEIENDKAYIYLTVPTEKITQEDDSSFLIIYSKNNFITVSKYNLEIFEILLNPNRRVSDFSNLKNILNILDFISRSFEKSVRKIIRDIKANKADLNNLKHDDIVNLINHENKLNNYISSFESIIQNYKKIYRNKSIKFSQKENEELEGLIIDLIGTFNLCKSTIKIITNIRNYYSTKLSNDLNRKITVLTMFTIFLAIPTLFGSIYGMNISLPLQTNPEILGILAFLVVGIWTIMFAILRYSKIFN